MHNEMKYIVTDLGEAIIFPKSVVHKDVFRGVHRPSTMGASWKSVVSAGFVRFTELGHAICWGESESLKVKSNPEKDQQIIDRQTFGYATPDKHERTYVVAAVGDWLEDGDVDNATALKTIKKLITAGDITVKQLAELTCPTE